MQPLWSFENRPSFISCPASSKLANLKLGDGTKRETRKLICEDVELAINISGAPAYCFDSAQYERSMNCHFWILSREERFIPMKRTRNIAEHPFGLILALVGLMSVTTLVLELVALAQLNPSWISTGSLNIQTTFGWGGLFQDVPLN
jgi:hypothetical protein